MTVIFDYLSLNRTTEDIFSGLLSRRGSCLPPSTLHPSRSTQQPKLLPQQGTPDSPHPSRPPPQTPLLGPLLARCPARAAVSRLINKMEALLMSAQPQQTHLLACELAAKQSVFGHLPFTVGTSPELRHLLKKNLLALACAKSIFSQSALINRAGSG